MGKLPAILEIEQWCADRKGAFDSCEIFEATNKAFNVSIAENTRKREMAEPRRCYVWFCYLLMKKPHPQCIARKIGKSRPAVTSSFIKTKKLLEVNDAIVVANIQKVFTELKEQYERVQS